jgi:hypothetical protein
MHNTGCGCLLSCVISLANSPATHKESTSFYTVPKQCQPYLRLTPRWAWGEIKGFISVVTDPDHFDSDPESTFHFNAAPDPDPIVGS